MKIGFRAVCIHCDADLHVCANCKYYCPGKPNDCLVPGTDYVKDRERANLCEEFTKNQNAPNDEIKKKKNFDDLFY